MTPDLTLLESAARAATPGYDWWNWDTLNAHGIGYGSECIAACSPATVLSLIAELRAARRVVEAARGYCTAIVETGYVKGPLPGEFDDLAEALITYDTQPRGTA